MSPRARGDAGQVGGIEVIPFGLLVFVAGTLLIANAWGVVDARLAVDAAAREGVRAFVEADDPRSADAEAEEAARQTMLAYGRDPDRARVNAVGEVSLSRCARATYEVSYTVPAVHVPFIGGFGTSPFTVRARHSEVVDPYRAGVPGVVTTCG